MNVPELELPDFSGHPPAPKMTFAQFQHWVCEEIVPELARCGEMTREKLIADFLRNEGRQIEPWPDFGVAGKTVAPD